MSKRVDLSVSCDAPADSKHTSSDAVAPFLTQHAQDRSRELSFLTAPPKIQTHNNTQYCYRHNPDFTCNRKADQTRMEEIQQSLDDLPKTDQEAITHTWSIFSAAPHLQRLLILKGILSQSCFPQLSFIAQSLQDLIKIDFLTALPTEVSLKIIGYLDSGSVCRAAQVSHRWKQLADDDRVWHKLCIQHIDRKCPKCGWGLPLMHMARYRQSQTSNIPHCDHDLHSANTPETININNKRKIPAPPLPPIKKIRKTRPWKEVYSERFRVETNWRKNNHTLRVFKGHTDGITCIRFDHKLLITGSYDTTIKIWNIRTGEIIRTLEGHSGALRSLQFDDQKLISGSLDKTIKVWNLHNGSCISTYSGHEGPVTSVDFKDTTIISGSADCTVKIWLVENRTCFTLRGHTEWVTSVKIHSPTNSIFSASEDATVRMWDLTTKQCLRVFKGGSEATGPGGGGHLGPVQCVIPVSISHLEGELGAELEKLHLSSNSQNNNSDENENANNNNGICVPGESNFQNSIPLSLGEDFDSTSPASSTSIPTYLLTCSLDATIKLWDIKTATCLRTMYGHVEGVWDIAADTFRIVSGGHDKLIKIWDIASGKCMFTMGGHNEAVLSVEISDSCVASGSDDGTVRLYSYDEYNEHDTIHENVNHTMDEKKIEEV